VIRRSCLVVVLMYPAGRPVSPEAGCHIVRGYTRLGHGQAAASKEAFLDRKGPATWEPPIGIEPMTYALREGFGPSTAVRWITSAQHAGVLTPAKSEVVQGRC
jgi:hypothetical protein